MPTNPSAAVDRNLRFATSWRMNCQGFELVYLALSNGVVFYRTPIYVRGKLDRTITGGHEMHSKCGFSCSFTGMKDCIENLLNS